MKPRLCVMNLFLSAFLLYHIVTYHTDISIIWMSLLEHIFYRRINDYPQYSPSVSYSKQSSSYL